VALTHNSVKNNECDVTHVLKESRRLSKSVRQSQGMSCVSAPRIGLVPPVPHCIMHYDIIGHKNNFFLSRVFQIPVEYLLLFCHCNVELLAFEELFISVLVTDCFVRDSP
jgi:hypothetical protein